MTGKNVKERIGLGGMDADRIRAIMGEAPACPRKRRGTSGNDIMRPARKSGPMQPSVYGEGIPAWHCGRAAPVTAYSCRPAPETVHPGGSSRNGTVTLEGFINHLVSRHLEEYRETTDMILEESLPGPVIKARPP